MTQPGRARWLRPLAVSWCTAYAVVHAGWAIVGAPPFGDVGESFLPEDWTPVVPAALAAIVAAWPDAARPDTGRAARRRTVARVRAVTAWTSGTALLLYAFLFPLSLLRVVGALFGQPVTEADRAVLLAQGAGVVAGSLAVAVAVLAQRAARDACPRCGRVPGRPPARREDPTPRWARLAGHLAVAGCLVRLAAAVPEDVRWHASPGTSEAYLLTFVVLMVLAGTLLPLALVYRWGRVWPGWVAPLAGRPVPRWLVLGPALFVGAGLSAYFGVGGTAAVVTGLVAPDAFLVVTLAAYTLWGAGLLVAARSYLALTRPPCPCVATPRGDSRPVGAATG
ncbi:hypothetical protein [Micromonospora sp. URMC 103]|uniref:hypothetical protein n=1 Tax=Micromonospora sp. URMC 103 TaxID=3423406 RepID=UPI003F1B502D